MTIKDILLPNGLDISTELNDNVLILDGTNRYKACFIKASQINDNGYYVGGYVGFLISLEYMIRTLAPSRVVIVFDGVGGSNRRKKMYSGYKANRGKIKRYNREETSEGVDEEESMILQFKRLIDYLYNLPVTIISIDNIEADDTIAYIATKLEYKKCVIVSTDQDFYQLIEPDKCNVFNPTTKILINKEHVINTFNCTPKNFVYYKAIIGDISDNLKGVKGIGKETMKKSFSFLKSPNRVGIEEFATNLDDKTFNKMNNSLDLFERNLDMMDLSEPIIDVKSVMTIRNLFTEIKYSNRLNSTKLRELIINDGVTKSFFQFDNWINRSFVRLDSILSKK